MVTEYDGTALDHQVNGVWNGPRSIVLDTRTQQPLEIGARHFHPIDAFFSGGLSELMIFEAATSGYPFDQTICYLARKYDIPVGGDLDCGTRSRPSPTVRT